jgi:hypothetical protein
LDRARTCAGGQRRHDRIPSELVGEDKNATWGTTKSLPCWLTLVSSLALSRQISTGRFRLRISPSAGGAGGPDAAGSDEERRARVAATTKPPETTSAASTVACQRG